MIYIEDDQKDNVGSQEQEVAPDYDIVDMKAHIGDPFKFWDRCFMTITNGKILSLKINNLQII